MKLDKACDFERRCLELYQALLQCTAFVNFRRREVGEAPVLAVLRRLLFRHSRGAMLANLQNDN